jgi:hypothetical protein
MYTNEAFDLDLDNVLAVEQQPPEQFSASTLH